MSKSCRLLSILGASVPLTCAIPSFCHCRAEATGSGVVELVISVPRETFVQGEPVPVSLEIRNGSEKAIEVISLLEPEYLVLRFRVTDPCGRTRVVWPVVHAETGDDERRALNAGEKLAYTALILFGVVDGVAKFLFDKTGTYTVQAVYHAGVTREAVSSEPIAITVVGPDKVESQPQQLFMRPEQGRFAALYGGPQAAMDTFRRILREYPTSRFAPYAAYYLGSHYQMYQEYKQSIELFERILKDYKDFPVWADVMYQLAVAYRRTGKEDKARECISELISEDPCHLAARRGKELLRKLDSD